MDSKLIIVVGIILGIGGIFASVLAGYGVEGTDTALQFGAVALGAFLFITGALAVIGFIAQSLRSDIGGKITGVASKVEGSAIQAIYLAQNGRRDIHQTDVVEDMDPQMEKAVLGYALLEASRERVQQKRTSQSGPDA